MKTDWLLLVKCGERTEQFQDIIGKFFGNPLTEYDLG